ncbi:PH-like domain-containing protein [Actinacidiphila acididurans]|uniref:PH-like domain-containing protein n=1 Tax=Actinacidiphila acididurans TaxID=2784346 RepID=UPI003FD6F987
MTPATAPTPPAVLAAALAESGKHSAKVTDWTDRIGWIVGLALVVGLIYWLMRQGWQWRRTLQGGLPALPQAPADPGAELLVLDGRYHGSTTAGQWLDRIVAHGLGVRSKVRLTLTERGLDVDRIGAPGFFVPVAALRGARLDRAIAGKVLPEGGLLVVTWEHGGTLIDSGFRGEHAADHPAWVARIDALTGATASEATGSGAAAEGTTGDLAVAATDRRQPPAPRDPERAAALADQHNKEGAP